MGAFGTGYRGRGKLGCHIPHHGGVPSEIYSEHIEQASIGENSRKASWPHLFLNPAVGACPCRLHVESRALQPLPHSLKPKQIMPCRRDGIVLPGVLPTPRPATRTYAFPLPAAGPEVTRTGRSSSLPMMLRGSISLWAKRVLWREWTADSRPCMNLAVCKMPTFQINYTTPARASTFNTLP